MFRYFMNSIITEYVRKFIIVFLDVILVKLPRYRNMRIILVAHWPCSDITNSMPSCLNAHSLKTASTTLGMSSPTWSSHGWWEDGNHAEMADFHQCHQDAWFPGHYLLLPQLCAQVRHPRQTTRPIVEQYRLWVDIAHTSGIWSVQTDHEDHTCSCLNGLHQAIRHLRQTLCVGARWTPIHFLKKKVRREEPESIDVWEKNSRCHDGRGTGDVFTYCAPLRDCHESQKFVFAGGSTPLHWPIAQGHVKIGGLQFSF